jgi:hypothetical protein
MSATSASAAHFHHTDALPIDADGSCTPRYLNISGPSSKTVIIQCLLKLKKSTLEEGLRQLDEKN